MTATTPDAERTAFEAWALSKWGCESYRHTSPTGGEWDAWMGANKYNNDLLQQALAALLYHQEQTRPIQRTKDAIEALRLRLAVAP